MESLWGCCKSVLQLLRSCCPTATKLLGSPTALALRTTIMLLLAPIEVLHVDTACEVKQCSVGSVPRKNDSYSGLVLGTLLVHMVRQSNADEFEANARPGLQPWFATSLAATKQTQSPGILLCEKCEKHLGICDIF